MANSPIEQLIEKLTDKKSRYDSLHQALDQLNTSDILSSGLTIAGLLIDRRSVKSVVWVMPELDVKTANEIRGSTSEDRKSNRMCPIVCNANLLNEVRKFHYPLFRNVALRDWVVEKSTSQDSFDANSWEDLVNMEQVLPLSAVMDCCLEVEKLKKPEYFIVLLPDNQCKVNFEKSNLFKRGNAVVFTPRENGISEVSYFLNHSSFVEKLDVNNYYNRNCKTNTVYKNHKFENFVGLITKRYNQMYTSPNVSIYVGYHFSIYKDARLWVAFTGKATENDIVAVQALLYHIHQEQVYALLRDSLRKSSISALWSNETKEWFYEGSNSNESIPHKIGELTVNGQEIIARHLKKLLPSIPVRWGVEAQRNSDLEPQPEHKQFGCLFDALKPLCGYYSVTDGQADERKPITLNSLFLIACLAVGTVARNHENLKDTLLKKIEAANFLEKDVVIAPALSNVNAIKTIESWFLLIQSLCLNSDCNRVQLNDVSLQREGLLIQFSFDEKEHVENFLRKLLSDNGQTTGAYREFVIHIALTETINFNVEHIKKKCLVNIYPNPEDSLALMLEIIPPAYNLEDFERETKRKLIPSFMKNNISDEITADILDMKESQIKDCRSL